MDINDIRLNFNKDSLILLNLFIAFIMFGIALDLKKADFINLLKNPKPAFAGIFSQFILLPLLTLAILYTINPHPGLALGMILVAVCPGGNMSNFFSSLAGGNLALSIGLTAFSSTVSVFLTPLGFFFWGSLYPPSQTYLRSISLNPKEMFSSILLILIIPLILGIVFGYFLPKATTKLKKPIRYISLALLVVFIIGALSANWKYFLSYIHILFGLVFLMNAAGLLGGYFFAKILSLPVADRRTIAIETGIQNSGLGLALVFGFFDGLGSMAMICAWWGIWHLISGWSLATYWSYQTKKEKLIT